ncbi:MAG: TonB-dependent receptor [Chloracidobacterium sp.]|nr:TonB-dependent receptor [Chloracidobacterium sp.]
MIGKPIAIVMLLVGLLLNFDLSVSAQGTTTRVTGTVADSAGAAVSGATVVLRNEATGISLSTETNSNGFYVFDLVQPGNYSVTVEKAGFKKFVSSNNNAQVNIPIAVNVILEVGDVAEVVTVESSAELVQTATSGNVGSTLGQREIESLPIVGARGRNPFDLLNFQPGVTVGSNTGGGIHVHGARDRAFNFTLDGIDINESTAGGSNFTPLRTNPESIQELQIVTSNFTAELGRSSGAQVSLTTRSGSNRFTGNIFEFYQTPDFHANEWEFNKQGIAKRQFVQHIYGGSVGGPIIKDRAFFFVNLQMLRAAETRLQTLTVYTPQARAGLYRYVQGGRNAPFGTVQSSTFPTGSAVNEDGSPRFPACGPGVPNPCIATYDIATGRPITIDPFIVSYLELQSAPNNFTVGDGLNTARFQFVAPQIEKQYDFVTRFDFKLNDRNQFYVRYAQGEQNTFGDIANSGLQRIQDGPSWVDTFRNPKNLAINYRWSPTARFANEFIFGLNTFGFKFEYPASNSQVPFILNNVTDFDRNFAYNARSSRTWQFVDNMTFDLSPHTLKFGVNFRLGNQFDDRSSAGGQIEPQVTLGTGNSSFTGWDIPVAGSASINTTDRSRLLSTINDLIGRIGGYTQGFVVAPGSPNEWAPAGTRWNWTAYYPEYDFYIQDTWRFRSNLTFDLGVRWEAKLSPSSKDLPVLTPSQGFTYGSTPTNTLRWEEGDLYQNDYDNFSPSVGLAWDPFKSGKTSIRANYRLSYDRFPSQVFASFVYQNAPGNTFQASVPGIGSQNLLIRNGLPDLTPAQLPDQLRQPPAFATTSIVAVDPDIQFPESHQWFAGIQREIWAGNVLEVNYIGRRGVHLFGAYNANQVNIFAQDPRCNQNFLEAFNAVRGGSTSECLINYLFTGNNDSNAGTTTFRGLSSIVPTLSTGTTGGSVATAALVVSQHTTGGVQTIGRANAFNNPYFFQSFPQFTGGLNVLETNDLSRYNGLEIIVRRRFSQGLSYQVAYTYSVSKDTRSWDPTFATANAGSAQSASSTPFDLRDRSLNYAWSDFDRRHVIQSFFTYELPFGRGRTFGGDMPRALDWFVGGWQISGLINLGSGRPYTFYSGRNTLSNAVQSPVSCNGCPRTLGTLNEVNGIPVWFTAEQLAGITQPEPGELGNTGRNYFIGPRSYTMDGSISKKLRFSERWSLDLRMDAKNLTNTPTFGLSDAAMLYTSSSVGQINNTVLSFSRRVQFSAKLNF